MKPDVGPSNLSGAIELEQQLIKQQYAEIARASQSVIQIAPYTKGKMAGIGSGVVVNERHILTAAHVVKGADDFVYYMSANGYNVSTTYDGGDIIVDESLDIALVPLPEVFRGYVPALTFGSITRCIAPQFLIGFPAMDERLDWDLHRNPTIHKVNARLSVDHLVVAEVFDPFFSVGHGISGGPIVDSRGLIIGIATSGISRQDSHLKAPVVVAKSIQSIQTIFALELYNTQPSNS